MLYSAAFDLRDGRQGFGTVTLTKSGESDLVLDLTEDVIGSGFSGASQVFNHYGFNDVIGEDLQPLEATYGLSNAVFCVAMTNALQAAAVDASWPDPLDLYCAFDGVRYTFGYSEGNTFNGLVFSNTQTQRLFGFTGNFSGTSSSEEGTALPNYLIQPALTAVTMSGDDGYIYEPRGISSAKVSASGTQYGLPRALAPVYRNWIQQAEPRAKTIRGVEDASHPGTHQLLFESCRSVYPFIVIDGFGDDYTYLFRLRPQGSVWSQEACSRMGGDMDDALFNVRYQAQQLGSIVPITGAA